MIATGIVRVSVGAYSGEVAPGVEPAHCTRCLEPLLAAGFADASPVSRSRDRETYRLDIAPADRPALGGVDALFVKRYQVGPGLPWLEAQVGMHKAQRAWRFGHALRERAVPTPAPLARLWRSRGPMSCEHVVVTAGIAGGISLREFTDSVLQTPAPPGDTRRIALKRHVLRELAALVARVHLARAYHGDFTAHNVFIGWPGGPDGDTPCSLYLIDLDAVRHAWRISDRRRVKNLDEIGRNVLDLRVVTTADRLRFLRHYLEVNTEERRALHDLFRAVRRRTMARLRKYGQRFR